MAERRWLTLNERAFIADVFGDTINLDTVEVVRRKAIPGGFAPWGSVNMEEDLFALDYIGPDRSKPVCIGKSPNLTGQLAVDVNLAHFFLHELAHVWQHFVGMPMGHERARAARAGRALWRWAGKPDFGFNNGKQAKTWAIYSYRIQASKPDLLDYTMEQQGEIIADYFALTMWNRPIEANDWVFNLNGATVIPTRAQLSGVLKKFLDDPAYPMDRKGRGLWRARAWARGINRS